MRPHSPFPQSAPGCGASRQGQRRSRPSGPLQPPRAAGQVLGGRGPHLESDQISGSQRPEASTGVSFGGPQAIYPGWQRGGLRGTSQGRRMCRRHLPKTCFVLVRGGGQGAWWGLHVHSLLPTDPTAWARETWAATMRRLRGSAHTAAPRHRMCPTGLTSSRLAACQSRLAPA